MNVQVFTQELIKNEINFFTGIPDSKLKSFYDYLYNEYGISKNHIIAENEGGCVALASGYYLSTGKIPCVYMQNSGIGNAINPICSLTSQDVYAIPTIYVIGWRGEIGFKDEPQHLFQGKVTLSLLDVIDIQYYVIDENTNIKDIKKIMKEFKSILKLGKSVAFVVKKGGLTYDKKVQYKNKYRLVREKAIEIITRELKNHIYISTTGKISRELFEIREKNKENHDNDFLTVGSMGHTSLIGLEIALNKSNKNVCILDGDGALIMHMGSLAIIGSVKPKNFTHIVLNNESHESVGGIPTVSQNIDFVKLALSCGYKKAYSVKSEKELLNLLSSIGNIGPILVEIKVSIYSRNDLGRPTTTPIENKNKFMYNIKED